MQAANADSHTIREDEWHLVQGDRDVFYERLKAAQHRKAYDYWEEMLLLKGCLPGRADFDPTRVYKSLPWLNLVDVVETEHGHRFRQRLIGTGLVERFGRDVTGQWYEDCYHPDFLPDHIAPLKELIANRKPTLTRIRFPAKDKKHVIYTRLMLPMASDGKNVDLIVQVMAF